MLRSNTRITSMTYNISLTANYQELFVYGLRHFAHLFAFNTVNFSTDNTVTAVIYG